TGFKYRGVDYARARDVQRDWTAYLTALLGDDAVLAVPTTPVPATVIGDREGTVLGRLMTRLTAPFNLAGAPVLSVPVGNIGALPVGMQSSRPRDGSRSSGRWRRASKPSCR